MNKERNWSYDNGNTKQIKVAMRNISQEKPCKTRQPPSPARHTLKKEELGITLQHKNHSEEGENLNTAEYVWKRRECAQCGISFQYHGSQKGSKDHGSLEASVEDLKKSLPKGSEAFEQRCSSAGVA